MPLRVQDGVIMADSTVGFQTDMRPFSVIKKAGSCCSVATCHLVSASL